MPSLASPRRACLASSLTCVVLLLSASCDGESSVDASADSSVDAAIDGTRPSPDAGGPVIDVCPSDAPSIVLRNGQIITVDRADTITGEVRIEGARIAEVGDSVTVPPGACVIDLEGRSVVPGLVDSHVHLVREVPDH